ncbi:ArnT family glycosyltransferase [Paenibacillus ginsengarvi]|uniref:ArnT family glycosyltransferase n=1 Tax=Paenibacillus ginsengarvi TaxID=400777 RepID=UPI0013158A75|nr:glycosyltransferase family 39 protein [Paenibacillus ginsengarvi]
MEAKRTWTQTGEHHVSRWLAVGGIVLFGWMLWHSFANASGFVGSGGVTALLVVGAAVIALLVAFVLDRYMGRAASLAVVLTVAVGLRLIWIWSVDTQPVSDFLDMHSAALNAASGDFSFGTSDYFTRWPYQLGFALYEALPIKLFGSSLIVLKLFNVLFQAATAVLVYLSAARAFGESAGKMASLFYALYVPHIMMCSVLTNQHISVFFYFLGMYVLIRSNMRGTMDWLLIGICFAIGNWMRPMGGFFIIGLLAYAALFLLAPRIRERSWLSLAAKCAGVLAVYWLLQQAAGFALAQSGVTSHGLTGREPYWKFVIGLNPATNGGWSYDDTVYVTQFPLGEERNRAELELLKERLEDKRQVAALFVSKTKTMWGAEDSAPMWSMADENRPVLYHRLVQAERIEYVLMALFGLIAMAALAYRGGTAQAGLYTLLLLGYAALHVVIEVQTRYRFDIFPCIFVLQSYGAALLLNALPRKSRGTEARTAAA